MILHEKFKKVRLLLNKTQREMASAIGKSFTAWQQYESGSIMPGGHVFEELAKLGFNPGWFFSDDVPMLLAQGQEEIKPCIGEPPPTYHSRMEPVPHSVPINDLSLGQSVELLAKIYNSGNQVMVRAIAANLHAFSEAVDNKAVAQKAIDMMEQMNERLRTMEKLKNENEALKSHQPDVD